MVKGQISVQTENIFPIIKQFLYSDQEIFLRELVSNAVDATTKVKALASRGDLKGDLGDTTIDILLDKAAKTLTIRDRGIGMNEEEVNKYLNQVAFSSATEFLEKFKGEPIIGHFGLGFYSAFMVASKVNVVTKSYKEEFEAVSWECDGNPEYFIGKGDRDFRGTDIILHISDDCVEYLENDKIEGLLKKYCSFLPVEIRFGTKKETTWEGEGEDRKSIETEVENIINNPNPLWKKAPKDLVDEDYKNFYQELYPYSQAPHFWIHLNIDYPFNLTGVLYLPKIGNSIELQKNKIQLYSNQVFVADDVKEIVPDFLMLLHGVIDSPDIPLNVSRSYLQSDRNVKKISSYITKKVAEKLLEIYKNQKEEYESKWKDISTFVKYGMISDESFAEKAMKFALVQNIDNQSFIFEDYKEKVKGNQTDKHNKVVILYTNNVVAQDGLIAACKQKGYDVVEMSEAIDNHFMQHLEYKMGDVVFVRIDSETINNLIQKDEKVESVLSEKEQEQVKTIFEGIAVESKGATVQLQAMGVDDSPVVITKPEFMRRMKEMQQLQGMNFGDFPDMYQVVVNTNHPLVANKLLTVKEEAAQKELATYLYQLAQLNHGMLKGSELSAFVANSLKFLQ